MRNDRFSGESSLVFLVGLRQNLQIQPAWTQYKHDKLQRSALTSFTQCRSYPQSTTDTETTLEKRGTSKHEYVICSVYVDCVVGRHQWRAGIRYPMHQDGRSLSGQQEPLCRSTREVSLRRELPQTVLR
ncbi:hypothetical protein LSAT2_027770 [Lamellibrachia satsuma]|nr:hypothetical protein LSAT2_027770 [Lamellibrachia satsuma]